MSPTKKSDKEEYERFLDLAKKVEASEDPKEFDRAFGKVAKPVTRKPS